MSVSFSQIIQKTFIKLTAWMVFLKHEKERGTKKISIRKYYLLSKGFCSDHPIPFDFQKNKYTDYISDLENIKLAYINYPYGRLVRDKLVFSYFFNSYFRTPVSYCTINKGKFQPVNIHPYITSLSDLIDLAKQRKIILKPMMGTGGNGIILLEVKNDSGLFINKKPVTQDDLHNIIESLDTYLVTEIIEQGEFAKKFFPDTANTIRLTTFYDSETSVPFIPYSFMRFGRKNSIPADNISQGGIFSMIDVNTGQLTDAIEIVKNQKPNLLQKHPDTDAVIKGVIIPRWDQLKEFFIKLGCIISPFMKIVGWDIILTDDSFVVLEGNNGPNLYNNQGAGYPLAKVPEVKKFLEYHKIRS